MHGAVPSWNKLRKTEHLLEQSLLQRPAPGSNAEIPLTTVLSPEWGSCMGQLCFWQLLTSGVLSPCTWGLVHLGRSCKVRCQVSWLPLHSSTEALGTINVRLEETLPYSQIKVSFWLTTVTRCTSSCCALVGEFAHFPLRQVSPTNKPESKHTCCSPSSNPGCTFVPWPASLHPEAGEKMWNLWVTFLFFSCELFSTFRNHLNIMQIEVTWLLNIMKNAHSGSLCHMEITSAEMLWNKSPLREGWIGQKWTADTQEAGFVLTHSLCKLPALTRRHPVMRGGWVLASREAGCLCASQAASPKAGCGKLLDHFHFITSASWCSGNDLAGTATRVGAAGHQVSPLWRQR